MMPKMVARKFEIGGIISILLTSQLWTLPTAEQFEEEITHNQANQSDSPL
jgi:hypothetical protein